MDTGGNDLLFGSDRCMGNFDAGCKMIVDVVVDMFADLSPVDRRRSASIVPIQWASARTSETQWTSCDPR